MAKNNLICLSIVQACPKGGGHSDAIAPLLDALIWQNFLCCVFVAKKSAEIHFSIISLLHFVQSILALYIW